MDFPSLSGPLPTLSRPDRPVNVYELLGIARSEGIADLTLDYFLDPSERHGLSSLVLDALLWTLDGAPLIGPDGHRTDTLGAAEHEGTAGWTVQRQVQAASITDGRTQLNRSGYIDLYLTNDDKRAAIIIENKIDALLNNPLEAYAKHALAAGYESVVVAVLAPYEHVLSPEQGQWVSSTITYSALLTKVQDKLQGRHGGEVPKTEDVRRSLDLLKQFIEVRKDSTVAQDYAAEARFVNEFREVRADNRRQLDEILDAVQQVNQLTRARSKRLVPLLRERLDAAGLNTGWEAHGSSPGRWPDCWNAYHFTDADISVELMMSQDPNRAAPIFVKAYPGRSYELFPDQDNVPLGVGWSATDDEIADAFAAHVGRVLSTYGARQRASPRMGLEADDQAAAEE